MKRKFECKPIRGYVMAAIVLLLLVSPYLYEAIFDPYDYDPGYEVDLPSEPSQDAIDQPDEGETESTVPAEMLDTMADWQLSFVRMPAVSGDALTFSINHEGEQALIWGYDFCLEQMIDGAWRSIPKLSVVDGVYLETPAVACELAPGDTELFTLYLTQYGLDTLEAGTYRVLIPITLDDLPQTRWLEIPVQIDKT